MTGIAAACPTDAWALQGPRQRRCSSAFTLIELLITLAILAILGTMAMPLVQVEVQRTREHDLRRALNEIRAALDAYKRAYDEGMVLHEANVSGYPPKLEVLVEGLENAKDPAKHKVFFLRRIPRDPMSDNPSLSDADTWAKRSYASEANEPAEGSDVYDVYSRSKKMGLNGQPYARW